VVKASFVKGSAKGVQILLVLEDQSAAGNVIHASELHSGEPLKLVKDRSLSLVTLSHRNCGAAGSISKDRLKRIQDAAMRGSPFVDDVEVLLSLNGLSDIVSCAIDSPLGPSGVCGFSRYRHGRSL
jgi:hypothetical protein